MSEGTLSVKDSRSGKEYEIPIWRNTVRATDFKKIKTSADKTDRADKVADGLRLYDPGLQNTTVLETSMTFADGDRGLLLLRGYALEQLWQSSFEDLLHLMVWKKRESPPMPLIVAGLSAFLANDLDSLPAFNGGNIFHGDISRTDIGILKTVAAYAVTMGISGSHRRGITFTSPDRSKTYHENLFIMMGIMDPSSGSPDPLRLSCFRRFTALNSDHGMALSVFSLLVTASGLADPISGVISSLSAAYSPLHFGAPEAAYKTISKISSIENVPGFLEEVKSGRRRLFGYGHRTYKTIDPRVEPIKKMLVEMNPESDPLLNIAREIDRVSATDEYFVKRGLHANADFYGVFFFIALGFQPEEIPVAMFSQRLIGVMAHYRESMRKSVFL
ncbi:hypothetical protein D6D17_10327 [Aureobasidium pullulans]|nr:hypothetical protein D6D17_10327 [Aureobasidium pullulans]